MKAASSEPKLNVPVIKKWIKALLSGKYQQGQLALHFISEGHHLYCCLGVLCDISGKGCWSNISRAERGAIPFIPTKNIFATGVGVSSLPKSLRQWVGISNKQEDELIEMNDSGKKFPTIAKQLQKWIDRQQRKSRNKNPHLP